MKTDVKQLAMEREEYNEVHRQKHSSYLDKKKTNNNIFCIVISKYSSLFSFYYKISEHVYLY